jgi:hypothetical protein
LRWRKLTDDKLRWLSQRIVEQAIRDVACGNKRLCREAVVFMNSEDFLTHAERAGYPPELTSAVNEMVVRSKAQRRGLAREIMELLRMHWSGKNKAPAGPGQ